jgi:hypothetical protein
MALFRTGKFLKAVSKKISFASDNNHSVFRNPAGFFCPSLILSNNFGLKNGSFIRVSYPKSPIFFPYDKKRGVAALYDSLLKIVINAYQV